MTSQTETTKTFKRLAQIGGFYPQVLKRSHRGLVAKLSLPRIEKYELAQFSQQLPRITFRNPVPVKEYGKIVSYI